jgi:hypothetical protein
MLTRVFITTWLQIFVQLLGPQLVTLNMWDSWTDPGAYAFQGTIDNQVRGSWAQPPPAQEQNMHQHPAFRMH